MSILDEIVSNQVLISAALGWLVAQFLKTMIDIWYNKSFSPDRLWGSGGMPSSHSATVCALATSSALKHGFAGFEFAVTFIFALVVMYDAMGVRRETGKQAKLLNMILENNIFEDNFEHFEERLKEFVGHTPLQVFMGAILGIKLGLMAIYVSALLTLPAYVIVQKRGYELPFVPFLSLATLIVYAFKDQFFYS